MLVLGVYISQLPKTKAFKTGANLIDESLPTLQPLRKPNPTVPWAWPDLRRTKKYSLHKLSHEALPGDVRNLANGLLHDFFELGSVFVSISYMQYSQLVC